MPSDPVWAARRGRLLACVLMVCASLPVSAFELRDPFAALAAIPGLQETGRACPATLPARPLNLADVIDTALCRNPQTASAWATARARAADVGAARSAYLPELSASGSVTERLRGDSTSSGSGFDVGGGSGGSGSSDTRITASATLSYVLFDFGARGAALDGAKALLDAARATRSATLQSVYLDAVTNYYGWVSAEGALKAANEAERAAKESLDAATIREQVGTATRADRLQAQTAYAQSQLARVQAEGALRTSRGSLANVMGLGANTRLDLAPPPLVTPAADFTDQLDPLVSAAIASRPDLVAAAANLSSAESDVDAARATGRPTLSANLTQNYTDTGPRERETTQAGLSLSVPIFSGFETTYRVRGAEARLEASRAELERLRNQATLEVFQAHSELITQTQSVFTAQALVTSAQESQSVARGRYEAGVGTILDLINAQSSAADAQRQLVLARSNWASARTRLAQAVGVIDTARDPQYDAASPATGAAR
ncbi:MAG: outer rane efflux protein [Panacagrimonas sp.]|jgi:TolC family type I secretion outer membrane protein|nr:TolC family protein [Panacagrimonas sp.]MCC2657883.1 outer rane efflux protein [Panacagrimonas sp.]